MPTFVSQLCNASGSTAHFLNRIELGFRCFRNRCRGQLQCLKSRRPLPAPFFPCRFGCFDSLSLACDIRGSLAMRGLKLAPLPACTVVRPLGSGRRLKRHVKGLVSEKACRQTDRLKFDQH
jgi:hypothetical protein